MAEQLEQRVQEMEKQVSVLQQLAEISASLNAQVELRPLLQRIMEVATDIADCEAASVLLWNNARQQLIFMASTTLSAENGSLLGTTVPMDSIAGTIYKENRIIQVDDVAHDDRHYEKVDESIQFQTRNLLGVPLTYKNNVIGVLQALNKHQMPWTQEDHQHLSTLAAQAAVAIENTKLLTDLRKANKDLSEVDKLKNDFIGIASHELRTPLGVIMGYASFLQEEESETAKEHASKVLESALKLRRLIEDMVNLRYLKQNRSDLHISNIRTSDLMETVKRDLQSILDLQDYDFTYQPPHEDRLLAVDATRIGMALTALMNNAIAFTEPGGKVTMAATLVSKHEMHISVEDDGIGIEADQIERIFGEFVQVEDHMVRKHGGLGIGLSICRAIINAHGGRIWAESDGLGKGAKFTMALPTAD